MVPETIYARFCEEFPGMKSQIIGFTSCRKSKLYKGAISMKTRAGKTMIYRIKNDNTTSLETKK